MLTSVDVLLAWSVTLCYTVQCQQTEFKIMSKLQSIIHSTLILLYK